MATPYNREKDSEYKTINQIVTDPLTHPGYLGKPARMYGMACPYCQRPYGMELQPYEMGLHDMMEKNFASHPMSLYSGVGPGYMGAVGKGSGGGSVGGKAGGSSGGSGGGGK